MRSVVNNIAIARSSLIVWVLKKPPQSQRVRIRGTSIRRAMVGEWVMSDCCSSKPPSKARGTASSFYLAPYLKVCLCVYAGATCILNHWAAAKTEMRFCTLNSCGFLWLSECTSHAAREQIDYTDSEHSEVSPPLTIFGIFSSTRR